MFKLIFLFLFPLVIIISGWNFFKETVNDTYSLIVLPNSNTNGTIRTVNRIDAINGTFFDCRIEYKVGSNSHFLNGSISYDVNSNVQPGDRVVIRYNIKNPQTATIHPIIDLIANLLIALSIIIWMTVAFVLLIKRLSLVWREMIGYYKTFR
jgi:hypothetical protein